MAAHSPRSAHATILLVEDDDLLRDLLTDVLEFEDFRVVAASRPDEAVKLFEEHAGSIQVMVTDVIMRGMTGMELAKRLRAIRDDLQVLLISGYPREFIAQKGMPDPRDELLSKPFSNDTLVAHVDRLLGRRRGARDLRRINRRMAEGETTGHSMGVLAPQAG